MLFLFFVSLLYFVVVSGKRCEILLQNVRLYSLWLPLWKSCNTFISFSQKQLHMYSYIVLRLQKNVTFEVCIEGQRQICCFGVGKKKKNNFLYQIRYMFLLYWYRKLSGTFTKSILTVQKSILTVLVVQVKSRNYWHDKFKFLFIKTYHSRKVYRAHFVGCFFSGCLL